jgi:hypothetical protein
VRSTFCASLSLIMWLASPVAARAQTGAVLSDPDRVRLTEAMRVADDVCETLWPGWGRTALPMLLVTDSTEFLVGHPRPSADFARLGFDPLLKREVWSRPRQFSPALLATFPAVGGLPTIVIGSAERTGKSSSAWVLTLLHEHFHQWQYSQPDYYAGVSGLALAHGDTTGASMLDYPFPYDSVPVQQAVHDLAAALRRTLEAPAGTLGRDLRAVVAARDTLRGRLTAEDYRYLEFQLWQEGVARFIEYAAARAAERHEPSTAFRRLSDYEPYHAAADRARLRLREELERLALGQQRRVAFYPLGAAIALVLEQTRPDWKRAYTERPFALAALLSQ